MPQSAQLADPRWVGSLLLLSIQVGSANILLDDVPVVARFSQSEGIGALKEAATATGQCTPMNPFALAEATD
jgi:hypothetical protein